MEELKYDYFDKNIDNEFYDIRQITYAFQGNISDFSISDGIKIIDIETWNKAMGRISKLNRAIQKYNKLPERWDELISSLKRSFVINKELSFSNPKYFREYIYTIKRDLTFRDESGSVVSYVISRRYRKLENDEIDFIRFTKPMNGIFHLYFPSNEKLDSESCVEFKIKSSDYIYQTLIELEDHYISCNMNDCVSILSLILESYHAGNYDNIMKR